MASLSDIAGIQQSGVTVLSQLQATQAKLVPTNSSGSLSVNTLVVPGFVRVLGVSVVTAGAGFLHDIVALADITADTPVYALPATPDFYATNMVFHKGLALSITAPGRVALFFSRI
jgi:hypothetical protein